MFAHFPNPCFMSCGSSCSKDDRLWLGLVAFVLGGVVLLQRFDLVPSETWDYLWPSVLLVSGLKLMVGAGKSEGSCYGMEFCGGCDMDMAACACPMEEIPKPKKLGAKKHRGKK